MEGKRVTLEGDWVWGVWENCFFVDCVGAHFVWEEHVGGVAEEWGRGEAVVGDGIGEPKE